MKAKRFIFLPPWLLLVVVGDLAGCGGIEPDFQTKHGMNIWDSPYSQAEIEDLTDQTLEALEAVKGYTRNYFKRLDVYFEDHFIPCSGASGKCWGVAGVAYIEVYASSACLADTAFVHELLHIARGRADGDSDHDHQDQLLFGPVGIAASLRGVNCDG